MYVGDRENNSLFPFFTFSFLLEGSLDMLGVLFYLLGDKSDFYDSVKAERSAGARTQRGGTGVIIVSP